MADKVDKPKKKAKPKKDEKGVLAALPSTRPQRIGGHRAAAPAPAPKATAASSASKAAATTRPAPAAKPSKPATSAKKTSPAAANATASPRATATGRKVAEERTYPRPRPVSEGAPGIGTAGYRDQPSQESGRPSGVELASTAVKAAGEVAQLGITIGGHVLKRVVDRLPKP